MYWCSPLICEVCGAVVDIAYEVIYKGSRGYACEKCISKYGLIRIRRGVSPPKKSKPIIHSGQTKSVERITRRRHGLLRPELDMEELVEDYGRVIKEAREKLGLTQEHLAKKLGIKLSYLKKIEGGLIPPPNNLARKIERILNIRLLYRVEEVDEEELGHDEDSYEEGYTLGDLLRHKEW